MFQNGAMYGMGMGGMGGGMNGMNMGMGMPQQGGFNNGRSIGGMNGMGGMGGMGRSGGGRSLGEDAGGTGRREEFVQGKLFLGGLDNSTTKDTLLNYCRQW